MALSQQAKSRIDTLRNQGMGDDQIRQQLINEGAQVTPPAQPSFAQKHPVASFLTGMATALPKTIYKAGALAAAPQAWLGAYKPLQETADINTMQANKLITQAEATPDMAEKQRLWDEADRLLGKTKTKLGVMKGIEKAYTGDIGALKGTIAEGIVPKTVSPQDTKWWQRGLRGAQFGAEAGAYLTPATGLMAKGMPFLKRLGGYALTGGLAGAGSPVEAQTPLEAGAKIGTQAGIGAAIAPAIGFGMEAITAAPGKIQEWMSGASKRQAARELKIPEPFVEPTRRVIETIDEATIAIKEKVTSGNLEAASRRTNEVVNDLGKNIIEPALKKSDMVWLKGNLEKEFTRYAQQNTHYFTREEIIGSAVEQLDVAVKVKIDVFPIDLYNSRKSIPISWGTLSSRVKNDNPILPKEEAQALLYDFITTKLSEAAPAITDALNRQHALIEVAKGLSAQFSVQGGINVPNTLNLYAAIADPLTRWAKPISFGVINLMYNIGKSPALGRAAQATQAAGSPQAINWLINALMGANK